eukprot:XP_014040021.1 PREDICTED: programmed cell death 6-interacting protein-like [Salmo salar]
MAPPSQAQGPPYPTYQGYPGYAYQMPMGYNPYAAYGQYNMPPAMQPNMQPYVPYQQAPAPGQGGFPGGPPTQQHPYPYQQQPQHPPHQPYYPQQ